MERMAATYPRLVWLNPEKQDGWEYTASVRITRELVGERMFPVTVQGLDSAITALRQPLRRAGLHLGGETLPGGEPAPLS
jgi:uncharacterized protein with von Willebrand factor type A (vWA) domain